MLHVLVPVSIGTVVGLLSAILTKARALRSTSIDIAVGIGGALALTWFVEPLGNGRTLDVAVLAAGVFGAVFLVALVTLFARRGTKR